MPSRRRRSPRARDRPLARAPLLRGPVAPSLPVRSPPLLSPGPRARELHHAGPHALVTTSSLRAPPPPSHGPLLRSSRHRHRFRPQRHWHRFPLSLAAAIASPLLPLALHPPSAPGVSGSQRSAAPRREAYGPPALAAQHLRPPNAPRLQT
ncbi:hypothetical protein PVAP13_2KG550300 [Panicum virgatum]|uniref:Uncharacterized protein n=1 Tax=Panicum virgatum TaxID=38727 RepID=A0A8T0WHS1_PANVG|nr:hypothetical protein PVAP13_2KG550300 [Panicum virgatum]